MDTHRERSMLLFMQELERVHDPDWEQKRERASHHAAAAKQQSAVRLRVERILRCVGQNNDDERINSGEGL